MMYRKAPTIFAMTPRHYLRKYQYDTRLVTGRFYPSDPVTIERGDRVGVVLFHLGGPDSADTVTDDSGAQVAGDGLSFG